MSSVEFGTLFQFIRNGMSIKQDKSGEGLPISRIETIADKRVDEFRVGYAGLKESECRNWLMEKGDILFSHINSVEHIGKCAVYHGVPDKLVHGMNLLCLRCDSTKLLPEFAKYLIQSIAFRSKLSNFINKAVNQASVSIGNLKTICVTVPSLEEQKQIAEILDRAESLRAMRRQSIEHLNTLPEAIFLKMFGDPVKNPKNLSVEPLGDFLLFMTSGGRGWAQFYAQSGSRFIRSLDVQMNYIGDEDIAFVAPPDNAEARRTRVKTGDVLLTITGSRIGRVAAVPDELEKSYVSQHVAILRTDPNRISPMFLAFFLSLSTGGQRQIAKYQYGQTKPGLNFEQIKRFQIPLPSINLQQQFTQRVEAIEKLKATHQKSLAELDALFASLQHRAFRGEL
jgi:type I restriction enzyme S subunit